MARERDDKSSIISNLDDTALWYNGPPLYDEQEWHREHELITDQIGSLSFYPSFTSDKDEDKWWQLLKKWDDFTSVHSQTSQDFNKAAENQDMTRIQVNRAHGILAVGGALVADSIVQEMLRLSKRNEFEEKFSKIAPLMTLGNFAVTKIQISGVSIKDFLNFQKKKSPLVPYLDFLVKADLIDGKVNLDCQQTFDEIFSQNQDGYKNEFPNIIKEVIYFLPSATAAMRLPSDQLDPLLPKLSPFLKEAAQKSQLLSDKVEEIRKSLRFALFNPNSPEHEDLKTYLEDNLRSDKITRFITLLALGLNRYESIFDIYRQAQKLIRQGKDNSGIYQLMADSITEYAQEASAFEIITRDDLPGILDTTQAESPGKRAILSIQEIWQVVRKLPKTAFKNDYEIDPEKIDWGKLYSPQYLKVVFNKSNPKTWGILLSYVSDTGEETNLRIYFDEPTNTFKWNVLDDPKVIEDEEIKIFHDELVVRTLNVMQEICNQVEEENRPLDKGKPLVIEQPQSLKRERFEDPIYDLRKEVRAEQRQQQTPLISFAQLAERSGIKHQVVIPEGKDLEDLLKYLSSVDREIIKNALSEYNEQGTGAKWGSLRKLGHDGTPRFKLVIGCTVPKGARVLLRESGSGNGSRLFEILDIRYRKDIYRLNQL